VTQSSGVSLDASTDIFRPLILRLGMFAPLPMYEAAYGGISLFGYRPAPTGSMPVGAQNDAELSRRQSNLESLEGNKIMKAPLVRCGKPLSRTCRSRASGGRLLRLFLFHFPNGQPSEP